MKNLDTRLGYIIVITFWLAIIMSFTSCTKEQPLVLGHAFEIDTRLPIDSNGYYHLQLGQDWQTLHRISGNVSPVEDDWALTKVYWTSSHHWLIDDTLGYIVHQNWTLNDNGYMYTTNDTSYVTWFEGHEVPTINETCYSTNDGEINIMFAPVQNMVGDTITVTGEAHYADSYISSLNIIQIVIE
jgi:hypothetical protein